MRKRRVVPAPRQPRAVVHQPQGAQRFDQRQFARIEVVEFVVAVHQFRELAEAFLTIARQHHPDVLHGRAHAAVVEVDDVEHFIAAHHVAGVTVAVHADVLVRRGGVDVFDTLEQVAGHGLVGWQEALGDEVAFKQCCQRGMAEVLHAECFTVFERLGGADCMNAPEQLAEAIRLIEIARLRRTAAATRKQGETETGVFVQGLAVVDQRRHHRDFDVGQFEGELVFFEDGFVGPALRTVELGDQRFGVFDADLIDAVFVAVERENARIAEETDAFDGIEHEIGCKGFKRVGHADSCAQQAAASGPAW